MDERVEKVVADAYAAFDRWCTEHGVESDADIIERVEAYVKWCNENHKANQ